MPAYPHIEKYYADLQELIEYGGSDNEQSIRPAFQNCLDAYCHSQQDKLVLVPELMAVNGVRPDGTVKDSLRLSRGYWEAKDTHDDLETEIQRKLNRGYPKENIIFEDSRTAVLIQHGTVAMQVDMDKPADLHRLILAFLRYVLPDVATFRKAWQQFKIDLPTILNTLREVVQNAESTNEGYQQAAAAFLELCHLTIGPTVSEADVREMLLQHILTKDIFLRVFAEDQYHQENNVARQLDALERTFFIGDRRRQTIADLLPYYAAITNAATGISDYQEKQQFLKAIYEDFYQAYNPAAADRLGVVYTPNEVVDFIIRGTDYLLEKHFGRSLADKKVQILDPATGTGTFITSLIDYLPADRLEYKYRHEIHANEVAILPYYIANLNIEYTYKERTGHYLEFPNLCFVDTLDNMDWQGAGATGGAVTRQRAFNLGGLSEENWLRVQEQNEKPISVIIGNPPYNDRPANWNDFNPNRGYPEIDQRIKDTYIAESSAQKTHQYDMYKRFIRWASDRLADDGIIGFITNRAYLESRQDDGFRQVAGREFSDIYVMDLGSDVRRNPKISGTTHNVFGIQTGVAIAFFVRDKSRLDECGIHYARREDSELATGKLAYLREATLDEIPLEDITPDRRNDWLDQSDADYAGLLPLTDRKTKFAKRVEDEKAVFRLFSNGAKTNRDEWVFDFDVRNLREKAFFFADTYNDLLDKPDKLYDPVIKWSSTLYDRFNRNEPIAYNDANRVQSLYRPFIVKHYFAEPAMNDRLTRNHYEMFGNDLQRLNQVICFRGIGTNKPFDVLATNRLMEHQLIMNMQCLPLYRYTEDGERVCNITEWGIRQFNDHYRQEWGDAFEELAGPEGITAEDIFAYTYAVLHDPVYRYDYRVDLLREFPRLPFYHEFDIWAKMGRELLDLHMNFESAEPYPLERVDLAGEPERVRLSAGKESGTIYLDDKTTLRGVPPEAWEYQLGSRSALEWVLDQYKERLPRDPTIAERFNTYKFSDYKEQVIDLLRRVCTVSVKTVEIVNGMAYWDEEGNLVVYDDRDKHEWEMLALSQWFGEPGGPDDDPEYQAWLASLPDIRDSGQ